MREGRLPKMIVRMEDIVEKSISNAEYNIGKAYYESNMVNDLEVNKYNEYMQIIGTVKVGAESFYCSVDIYEGRIVSRVCNCQHKSIENALCRHTVALMLAYYNGPMQEQKKVLIGERYTKGVLDYYEDQVMKEQDLELEEDEHVSVKMKLIYEGDGEFALGISLGVNKFYIVKDLYEFADNMLEGARVSYGKSLDFIHDISIFEEDSRPIVTFIIDKTQEYVELLRQVGLYRGFAKADRKTLPLGPKAFDEFFDLVEGKDIEIQFGNNTNNVHVITDSPRVSFDIVGEEDYYKLTTDLEDYEVIDFSRSKYILLPKYLMKLDEEFGRDVFPVLKSMYSARRVHGGSELHFSETLMKRFLLSSLSKIQKLAHINVEEGIRADIEPEHVMIKTFLDLDDEGSVMGDIEFGYRGINFNPYKAIPPEVNMELEKVARDMPGEYRVGNILRHYNFRTIKGSIYLSEESDIYSFVKSGIKELMEVGEVRVTERLKHINLVRSATGSIGLKIENNMLKVEIRDINMPLEEMKSILESYKLKNKYYRLKDGSFLDLAGGTTIGDLSNVVDGLGMNVSDLEKGEAELPKYRALYLDQVFKDSDGIEVKRDKYFKQIIRDVKNVEDADYEVPEDLNASLRSYQKTGYRWLKTMTDYGFGGILADDMGLGKTLQMIALILSEKNEGNKPSLVICPTSLVLNWQTEIAKFAPTLKARVVMGTVLDRKEILENLEGYDVIITSYELLKRDTQYYEDMEFKFCIADEAQYIKNANTLSAKSLKLLKGEVRFALTGTPIENSLAELWSIFDFIMPGYLFEYADFRRNYEMAIVKSQDEVVTNRLKKLIAPFIMRRLKKDVLKELPDKIETVIYNTMEDEQRKLYNAHLALAKQELEEEIKVRGVGGSHIKMLALLTRLRQLCCHPSMYLTDYHETSGKLEQCMEIVKDSIEAGHKILLFSQFTTMLDILSTRLYKEDINHFMLTGSTKAEERMRLVSEFNAGDTPVFLISLKAGGTGLNLTGADVVIHYDPWWNLSSQNQATDRAYRIGQKNKVQVFQMITKDSIEEKIKELQDKKIGLTESVLKEGEAFISKMSEDEIKDLFNGNN